MRNLRPSAEKNHKESDRYFIVPPGAERDGVIVLAGPEFHHCVRVSRLRRGEIVKLLDGEGLSFEARIERIGAREAVLEVISREEADEPLPVDIAFGVIKAPRLDLAVEKCTELGVRALIPFTSERSVWRAGHDGSVSKIERIRRKMIASCKQSGQSRFPAIEPPMGFEALVERLPSYAAAYLADQHAPAPAAERSGGAGKASVLGIVGPEGGLSPDERSRLVAAGAVPLSLGPFRLRSETAVICLTYRLLSRLACPEGT